MPIVRIDSKLVYFAHVPKCAGTAIERYLTDRFGSLAFLDWEYTNQEPRQAWNRSSPQHIEIEAFRRLIPPSFIDASFAVVRHPTQRILSVFRYQRDAENQIPSDMSFGDWLRQIPGQDPHYLDNHARPMSELVPEDATVFRLEEGTRAVIDWLDARAGMKHAAQTIGTLNTYSQRLALKDALPGLPIKVTKADHDWMAEYYAADFDRFGYVPGEAGYHEYSTKPEATPKKAVGMSVLVFGKSGQVATELQRLSAPDVKMVFLDRRDADLSNPLSCVGQIIEKRPDLVINAAAYTAVDKAEEEEALAMRINGETPSAMARAAAKLEIPFVHISSDYVFDGTGTTAWPTDAPVAPLGAYGRSKLAGEEGVRAAGGPHVILRTSWVFSAHGNNFVKTMLRLGRDRAVLRVVADQVGGPTAARDIAAACLAIGQHLVRGEGRSGTYHFAGAPDTSWEGFAREIFDQAGLAVTVTGIPTSDYPTPARRPLNSRLDCSATETVFGIPRPDWRASLAQVLTELKKGET